MSPYRFVSNHLNILRRMGLVFTRRVGRCIEYQCTPGLVRLEQRDGRLTLTVCRPSGATVTLGASLPQAPSPQVQAAPAVSTPAVSTPAVSNVEPDGARPAPPVQSAVEGSDVERIATHR